mgnify:CR=1 FL=1
MKTTKEMNEENIILEPTITFTDNINYIQIQNKKKICNKILINFVLTVFGIIIGSIIGTLLIFIYYKLN